MNASPGGIDFSIERQRHARFLAREDVLAQLDAWLRPGENGWVVITGGPGMGKSAVLSAWLTRREAAGATVPHHFVRRQVADWDQPEGIAASLSAQLEATFPELRDAQAKPERRLIELFGRISKRLGPSGDLVVLVDGLDETQTAPGDNPLPRFLPHHVPPGIRILCATRPTFPHLGWIEARNRVRRIDLDDRQWSASNSAVVCGFWTTVASEYAPPLARELQTAAIDRAEGNVLHAVMLHDLLRALPAAERRVDRLPRGLKNLIGDLWSQAAATESVRHGLGLLCAAQEALSLEVLAEITGWSYDERERFLPNARQLLTPDGRRVISASSDKRFKVWNLHSGRPLATLIGHADSVSACAVTPDGSGRPLITLVGHTDGVTACVVTPDGRRVISRRPGIHATGYGLTAQTILVSVPARGGSRRVTTISEPALGAGHLFSLVSTRQHGKLLPAASHGAITVELPSGASSVTSQLIGSVRGRAKHGSPRMPFTMSLPMSIIAGARSVWQRLASTW
jgi:AAA ATPase domain